MCIRDRSPTCSRNAPTAQHRTTLLYIMIALHSTYNMFGESKNYRALRCCPVLCWNHLGQGFDYKSNPTLCTMLSTMCTGLSVKLQQWTVILEFAMHTLAQCRIDIKVKPYYCCTAQSKCTSHCISVTFSSQHYFIGFFSLQDLLLENVLWEFQGQFS